MILSEVNQLRAAVANGTVGDQPPASNMNKLVWDDDLAVAAQTWADQCIYGTDPAPAANATFLEFSGEPDNLVPSANFYIESPGMPPIYQDALQTWHSGHEGWEFGPLNQSPGTTLRSFYTGQIWGRIERLGCAQTHCPTFQILNATWNDVDHFVCSYYPPGNYSSSAPYLVGPPATDCPASHTIVDGGLCAPTAPGLPIKWKTISPEVPDQRSYVAEIERSNVPIVKVEILPNGGDWLALTQFDETRWRTPAKTEVPLDTPLFVRLTAVGGEVLAPTNRVISNLAEGEVWSLGQNFTPVVASVPVLGTWGVGGLVVCLSAIGLRRARAKRRAITRC